MGGGRRYPADPSAPGVVEEPEARRLLQAVVRKKREQEARQQLIIRATIDGAPQTWEEEDGGGEEGAAEGGGSRAVGGAYPPGLRRQRRSSPNAASRAGSHSWDLARGAWSARLKLGGGGHGEDADRVAGLMQSTATSSGLPTEGPGVIGEKGVETGRLKSDLAFLPFLPRPLPFYTTAII
jgi:hypothetical protein